MLQPLEESLKYLEMVSKFLEQLRPRSQGTAGTLVIKLSINTSYMYICNHIDNKKWLMASLRMIKWALHDHKIDYGLVQKDTDSSAEAQEKSSKYRGFQLILGDSKAI